MKDICATLLTDESKLQCLNDARFWDVLGVAGLLLVLLILVGAMVYCCKE